MTTIYKICPAPQWIAAERTGVFRGSDVDHRDGFIHFSSGAQIIETAEKHFAGQIDLLLLRVDSAKLGDRLKWEPSRGGALFPHLYGDLDPAAVMRVEPLPLGPDGRHVTRSSTTDHPAGNCGRAAETVRLLDKPQNARSTAWISTPIAA